MSSPVILVENLSKCFVVGHRKERAVHYSHVALRDVVTQEMRNVARKAIDVFRGRQVVQGDTLEEFWALRDVNFEVQQGEVLGIMGRNGAGKSTLLKLLSRITEPTIGRITLRGRVASLLEIGTGFHPELTGRENIYLNGAILGMSRAEIRKKFDAIVSFAEVERFLDTPVKRYSSGMYVRLAFAVAAHLEPEILIVDEVLAVGDADFQKKCIGKMDEVSRRDGRTVLLVSHNMALLAELASRAILLENGGISFRGEVSGAISAYLAARTGSTVYVRPPTETSDSPHIIRVEVLTSGSNGLQHFGEPIEIRVWVQHTHPMRQGCLSVHLVNQSSASATAVYAFPPNNSFGQESGTTQVTFRIPALRANVGLFDLRVHLTEPPRSKVYEVLDRVCSFEVVRENFYNWWGPEICAYHEQFSVSIAKEKESSRGNHMAISG